MEGQLDQIGLKDIMETKFIWEGHDRLEDEGDIVGDDW